jgi:predicted DNA repair protein MutK
MASANLLALIDDIATTLDDVAVMTKVAAKKTAGVLGDDLAVNAEQVSGVAADRELPIVWAVAVGSAINKVILVPLALLISIFLAPLLAPLLILGGAFLCYEGFEKVVEKLFKRQATDSTTQRSPSEVALPAKDFERAKIKGAIRTDFILSAEIIVISLGTVTNQPWTKQLAVLCGISAVMTIGVYGLVAGIVKLDDLGLWLHKRGSAAAQTLGRGILLFAPQLMRFLGIAGTLAMFLVGGGIVYEQVHHLMSPDPTLESHGPMWVNFLVGIAVGAVCVGGVHMARRLAKRY